MSKSILLVFHLNEVNERRLRDFSYIVAKETKIEVGIPGMKLSWSWSSIKTISRCSFEVDFDSEDTAIEFRRIVEKTARDKRGKISKTSFDSSEKSCSFEVDFDSEDTAIEFIQVVEEVAADKNRKSLKSDMDTIEIKK